MGILMFPRIKISREVGTRRGALFGTGIMKRGIQKAKKTSSEVLNSGEAWMRRVPTGISSTKKWPKVGKIKELWKKGKTV